MRQLVRVVTIIIGLMTLAIGIWAFADPRSFYDTIATYPPYNVHLFHDVGSFQIGIGFTLLYSTIRRDGLTVALVGASVGAVMHAISHIIDRDLGGKTTDPWLLSGLALAIVVATVIHLNTRQR
jgi:uncharacterized membrane protein YidH (DUF202 family)